MDMLQGWAAAQAASLKTRALRLALLLPVVCAGCKSEPTMNPFLGHEPQSASAGGTLEVGQRAATEPLDPTFLGEANWFEQHPASYAKRPDDFRHWHHPRLDGHLHAEAPRSDLAEALASTDPIVATNAAILVAHWKAGDAREHLAAAIRADKLPLPLRCASAEALGQIDESAPLVRELLTEVQPPEPPRDGKERTRPRREVPQLHAELLRALARHAEPGDEQWFAAALANRGWQVRLEGIAAWAALPDMTLPDEALALRTDREPRVRAMAVRTIAAHREPRAVGYMQEALADGDREVRAAAVAGLSEIGTADATALLGRLKNRGAELQQAASLASAAAEGFREDLKATAADGQAQVRLAVAETVDRASEHGRQLAAETTAAAHETVRQASAQVGEALDQAGASAREGTARLREMQQLVDSLRQPDLADNARRQAITALERMAMDTELEVRVQAARAMGELGDPLFLPVLMALLSDEADVQAAAMASLVQVAGTDVATTQRGGPQSPDDQVRAWQLWYRDRQNAPGR